MAFRRLLERLRDLLAQFRPNPLLARCSSIARDSIPKINNLPGLNYSTAIHGVLLAESFKWIGTHTHTVPTRNISISEDAYNRLAALKRPGESFTEVINRLAGRRSILELVGLLKGKAGKTVEDEIRKMRRKSRLRLTAIASRMHA